MPTVPAAILKQLYRRGSLRNDGEGYTFTLRNHLAAASIVGLRLRVDGVEILPQRIKIEQNGQSVPAAGITAERPLRFPTGVDTVVAVAGDALPPGRHSLQITADTREIGPAIIDVADDCATPGGGS